MTTLRELPPPTPLFRPSPRSSLPPRPREPEPGDAPSAFSRLVHGLSRESDAGEAMMHRVLSASGPAPDTMSLLALQAGIYRYGETVDLAAQLVDKASSSVKTVVQGQ
jgi:hypothetical protein